MLFIHMLSIFWVTVLVASCITCQSPNFLLCYAMPENSTHQGKDCITLASKVIGIGLTGTIKKCAIDQS